MHQTDTRSARLVLADASIYRGIPFGATSRGILTAAEVVFNTAMTGYQESLTDPSYTGQILVQTFPLIGNVGANPLDEESPRVQAAGLVCRELARRHSNFRAAESLGDYLARHNILAMHAVDTRALTRRLRSRGVMPGVLTDRADLTDAQLLERARAIPSMAGSDLVTETSCRSEARWAKTLEDWAPDATPKPAAKRPRVLALDCGSKHNILRHLAQRGCEVTLAPHDTSPQRIRQLHAEGKIDGLFISNGPGDPAAVTTTIDTLRDILNAPNPIPTFGICLGHQLLALAAGARTYKLPFGHRGANHPVLEAASTHVQITSQNHGFAVDRASLEAIGAEVTHTHLNDNTVAGFRLKDRPAFAVQYHPEASPGPHDAASLFDDFVASMAR